MSGLGLLGVVLSLVCAGQSLACTSSAASVAPRANAVAPPLFVEVEGPRGSPALGVGPQCGPERGAELTPLFDGLAELSLPAGLDADTLDSGRGIARWQPRGSDCTAGSSADVVVLGFNIRPTSTTPMAEWHHRIFGLLDLPGTRALEVVAGGLEASDVTMTLGFPDDPVWDDTRIYMRVVAREDRLIALVFMAQVGDWAAFEPSFAASTQSLVLH